MGSTAAVASFLLQFLKNASIPTRIAITLPGLLVNVTNLDVASVDRYWTWQNWYVEVYNNNTEKEERWDEFNNVWVTADIRITTNLGNNTINIWDDRPVYSCWLYP